ncbi:GNAT family N-acetyltransferase [Streptacidiphilus sp. EB103A]|uniref:GNAT family N-acetyltransferase n=1 Tax=Streptacidiphilus sp. EB103A TaxID=3156275 RepID=UPI00351329B2
MSSSAARRPARPATAKCHCRADNHRSAAVAERLGMTLEGVRRQAWPYGGTRYDKQVWAVLAPEWASPKP